MDCIDLPVSLVCRWQFGSRLLYLRLGSTARRRALLRARIAVPAAKWGPSVTTLKSLIQIVPSRPRRGRVEIPGRLREAPRLSSDPVSVFFFSFSLAGQGP